MPRNESSSDKDMPHVDESLALSYILVAEGLIVALLEHPALQSETQSIA